MWPATQYIRPRSGKLYNPEPDFIHEIFGHQAMLGLPHCRKTLYKIGLASLGAS
jgi:phenylalanine-4-hydroxylase